MRQRLQQQYEEDKARYGCLHIIKWWCQVEMAVEGIGLGVFTYIHTYISSSVFLGGRPVTGHNWFVAALSILYVDHLCGMEDSNGRSVEYMQFLQCTSSRFLSVLSIGAKTT